MRPMSVARAMNHGKAEVVTMIDMEDYGAEARNDEREREMVGQAAYRGE